MSATVQNLAFTWDGAGNLKTRTDLQADKREEFDYDGLYRLTQSRRYATAIGTTASATDNFAYDTIGNLVNKGGAVGAYTFSNYNYGTRTGCTNTAIRPHAVYQVTVGAGTRRYCYDANGNLAAQTIASGTGTLKYDSSTWWVANLAKRISQGGGTSYSDFWYGAGRERIRQVAQKSATTSEATTYVGGLYEKFTRTVSGSPTTEYVHYIRGGDQAIAVVKRISGALQTRYLHRDHLGSVVALTDTTGAVIERYSYDAWGKRRDPATWVTPAAGTFSFDPSYTDRGYTGHEHIDHLGLVNMNGRVYDPEIGKFLSADPTTQYPESTQGWNRYSYCGNNPLSYTDPSGFSFWTSVMKVVGIVMQFVPGLQGWTLAWWQSMMMGFASGFLASGGNLKAGLMGAAGAALFAGTHFLADKFSLEAFSHSLLKGLAGGALQAAGGGEFKEGFLGAFAGGYLGEKFDGFGGATGSGGPADLVKRVVRDSVIGGVASRLGGGKFKNGAATAAFARLFNDELRFDGRRLRWVDDHGQVTAEWDAASGREGYQDPEYQALVDKGPIPEGQYVAKQGELQFIGNRSLLDMARAELGMTAWPGGESSWGSSRVWLQPDPGTNTLGRSGFSIHGGDVFGSAGCIDLAKAIPSFTGRFQNYGKDMRLTVKY